MRSLVKSKELVPVQRWVRHAPLTDGGLFPARFQAHLFRAEALKDAVIEVDVREPHPGFPPEARLTRSVVILHRAADLSHLAPLTQDPEATFEIDFVAFPGVEPGQHVRVAIWMSDGPLTGSNQPLPFSPVRCVSFS